ncbi:Gigaxonin [Galemys pyrenaicus]|uniref:Gigaxonin n=1 Tax=Galemys pyrenaicus TaxID=202257 RepID=A0A8J5ZJU8_GALPY|nr:Gigaxonin [Galemys pyrenaicus]
MTAPGSAEARTGWASDGTRLLIGRHGQQQGSARASRRNDATPRLLKGADHSRCVGAGALPANSCLSRSVERLARRARTRTVQTGRALVAGSTRGPSEPRRTWEDPLTPAADMAEGSAVSDPQHAARLLRALSSFREESRFCDAHLVLDGEEIPVQKNILAAASPYIRNLFHAGDGYEFLHLNKPCGHIVSEAKGLLAAFLGGGRGQGPTIPLPSREDKGALAKLVEAIRTNYNDRYDELGDQVSTTARADCVLSLQIRRHWGGNVLGPKSVARIAKLEKAKAKELATKLG